MFSNIIPWIVAAVIFVGAILLTGWQYSAHQVDLLKIQHVSDQKVIEAQTNTIKIQGQDMTLLSDLAQKSQTIVIKQQDTNKKLSNVKDSSTNHPFVNPDLLTAASIMRDSQQANPTATPSTNH